MGWHTGTATDHRDLLSKINTAAVADGWTQKRYVTGSGLPYEDELVLEGPGFGSGYEVYAQFRSYDDSTDSIFSIQAAGITSFSSTALFDVQIGVSPKVYMNLWNSSISYWISISDRRILVVAKVSNTYHSLYAGFIDPFSNPIEYPYPFYIAADSPTPQGFGDVSTSSRSVVNPYTGGAYIRTPAGLWDGVAAYSNQGFGWQQVQASTYTVYPYGAPTTGNNPAATAPQNAEFGQIIGHTDTLPLMPCTVIAMFNLGGQIGVLEGLFWTPAFGLGAEQGITIDGDDYIVFLAISRSNEQPTNFYVVKES